MMPRREECGVAEHYDLLIAENNDPYRDGASLRAYMDKWDGKVFLDEMNLTKYDDVLEIGVGTGRIAAKVIPLCQSFCGIDISLATVIRAEENLAAFQNKKLICADFLTYDFCMKFDVIYSSLTFMHIKEKQLAVDKISSLLNSNGRLTLSIDKNQSEYIDFGDRIVKVYPDTPEQARIAAITAGLTPTRLIETEFAYIITALKNKPN